MRSSKPSFLVLNGGSSSIKFAFFEACEPLKRGLEGELEQIWSGGSRLRWSDLAADPVVTGSLAFTDRRRATDCLLDWLETQPAFGDVSVVGHRVVHGMRHTVPEWVSDELLEDLREMVPSDPEHLPLELELIESCRWRYPQRPQLVCFDTAFHAAMPWVAQLLPIPRRFNAAGLKRYGFHGLSYTYLLEELVRIADPAARSGRVILAHLGNGASLAAVKNGQSIDTSMGFSPTAGLVMSTRSGDLDPGVAPYLARTQHMTTEQFYRMVTHESGLLGISETSSDMRDLLARETTDVRASEAVEMFCYQAKKWIGSFAAVLGGLDTLVFSGGIGEHCAVIRSRICDGLGFLGIELDEARNAVHDATISRPDSRVVVRVIPTDEELMIARSILRLSVSPPATP
jgi:acetate kinase